MLQNLLIGRHTHRAHAACGARCSSRRSVRRAEIAAREEVERVIDLLDLQHHREALVAGLPYGVRKVVELARALCTEPKLLLLDEPSSGLNVEETDDMAFWIQDIQHELGITVLMVEHDMTLVSKVSDRVLAMNQGEVLAMGTPREVQRIRRDRGVSGLAPTTSSPLRRAAHEPDPPSVSDSPSSSCSTSRAPTARSRRSAASACRCGAGEIATVLGSNGAGKTTILKTISGIIDPRKGSIEFKGDDITARDPAHIVQQGLVARARRPRGVPAAVGATTTC